MECYVRNDLSFKMRRVIILKNEMKCEIVMWVREVIGRNDVWDFKI